MISHPKNECKLIVHGDDFGISKAVNEGIVRAKREGILTSTSLMANGRAFEHAIDLLKKCPELDVGVHLTLTGEKPLCSIDKIDSLVDGEGLFYSHVTEVTKKYYQNKLLLDQVEVELEAQIRRVLDSGVVPSHLDGHQHVHMLPKIRVIVGYLAEKYKIPAVRLPRERLRHYMFRELSGIGRVVQMIVLNTIGSMSNTKGADSPKYFFGFYHGGKLNLNNVKTIIRELPVNGVCELMCHPGLGDGGGRYEEWGYHWKDEFEALTSPEVVEMLQERGVELVSFKMYGEKNNLCV